MTTKPKRGPSEVVASMKRLGAFKDYTLPRLRPTSVGNSQSGRKKGPHGSPRPQAEVRRSHGEPKAMRGGASTSKRWQCSCGVRVEWYWEFVDHTNQCQKSY